MCPLLRTNEIQVNPKLEKQINKLILNCTGNRTFNVKDMFYFWCKIVKLTSEKNERNELSNMNDFKFISTCHQVHRCRVKTIILYLYVTYYTFNYTYMFISILLRFTIIGRGFFWGGRGCLVFCLFVFFLFFFI